VTAGERDAGAGCREHLCDQETELAVAEHERSRAVDVAELLEDLERGRRIELPWLSGAVVRLTNSGLGCDTWPRCNALHPIEERFCRWLLQSSDRAASDTVTLTQELLAEMLGVRRTSANIRRVRTLAKFQPPCCAISSVRM
jgi:CRP-like cAMP-binding protein